MIIRLIFCLVICNLKIFSLLGDVGESSSEEAADPVHKPIEVLKPDRSLDWSTNPEPELRLSKSDRFLSPSDTEFHFKKVLDKTTQPPKVEEKNSTASNVGLIINEVINPTATASSTPLGKKNENEDIQLFNMNECDRVKGCLYKPFLCVPFVNCTYAVSYRSDADRVYLEILGEVNAPSNSYVAVGLSNDMIMGDDSVTECSSFNNQPFSGRLSFNLGKSNRRFSIDNETEQSIITTHYTKYINGVLYCRISQVIQPPATVSLRHVQPLNSHYHMFIASGLTKDDSTKRIHSLDTTSLKYPYVSYEKIGLIHFQHDSIDFNDLAPLPPNQMAARIIHHETEEAAEYVRVNPETDPATVQLMRIMMRNGGSRSVQHTAPQHFDELINSEDVDDEGARLIRLIKVHGNVKREN